MSDKPSGFFSRWTQRRQDVEDERLAEEVASAEELVASEPDTEITDEAVVEQTTDDNQVLTAEDLPDPEKIEVGGSFASFMGANVDPVAKAAALKALWKQPQYNEIDGLLEYALDYSNQPKLSAEQSAEIAKKVFRHVIKKEEQEEQELADSEIDEAIEATASEGSENNQLDETDLHSEAPEDILDINKDELAQNEPDSDGDAKEKVV